MMRDLLDEGFDLLDRLEQHCPPDEFTDSSARKYAATLERGSSSAASPARKGGEAPTANTATRSPGCAVGSAAHDGGGRAGLQEAGR